MWGYRDRIVTGVLGISLAVGAVQGADDVKSPVPLPTAIAPPSVSPPIAAASPTVSQLTYSGNTVFRNSALDEIALPLLTNRLVDLQALEKVRVALTRKYVEAGYINSGAIIPSQDIGAGVVKVEIVEGALTDVRVSGNNWTKSHMIAGRILRGASHPLNVNKLQENLEALRVIYPIGQVNSRLEPGDKPGDAALEVKVKENDRFHAGTRFRNDLPPSSGANQFDLMLASPNLLGYFDEADFDYGLYRFGQGESKFLPGDNYSGSYKIPLTVYDTKVGGFYRRSTASVQEEPFNVLGISSDVESYGVTLDQPIINTVNRQLVFSLSAEHKISRTFLFGQPFSFSVGPVNGESVVTALRPAILFTQRDEKSVFSARFTTTFGLDAWDATVHSQGHDAEFISFLAQAQYMRRLGDTRSTLVARVTGQYATDGLLPSEQFSVGGANTVRGYRENTLVRDSGIASTVEIRTPLFGDARRREWLVIAPFFDVGAGWNLSGSTPSPTSIMSTGIGLLSSPAKGVNASLQWGYGLREIKGGTGDAQDYGIHFNLTWWFL